VGGWVYCKEGNTKVYLSQLLKEHALWQEKTMWISLIGKSIMQKLHESVMQVRQSESDRENKETWLQSGFGIKRVAQGIWSAGEELTSKA